MSIFELVKTALDTLSPAVAYGMKPFITTGALPERYMDYFIVVTSPAQHADNVETARGYLVQISIFDRSGLASLPNVDGAMIAAGFMKGPERQLPKDPGTGHFGFAKDFTILLTSNQ